MNHFVAAAASAVLFVLRPVRCQCVSATPGSGHADRRAARSHEAFAAMDGVWRGPAWTILPSGEKHNITQTERIGPFLDGSIKVIEGRGYNEDGKVGFNAFGIISYNPATKVYIDALPRAGPGLAISSSLSRPVTVTPGKFRPGQ